MACLLEALSKPEIAVHDPDKDQKTKKRNIDIVSVRTNFYGKQSRDISKVELDVISACEKAFAELGRSNQNY